MIPFTVDQCLIVFEQYNVGVWPAQVFLYTIGIIAICLTLSRKKDFSRIWNEIRSVWPAGRGITYRRLDSGGLQWPCSANEHSGTEVMHTASFPVGRAALRRVPYRPTDEIVEEEFPLLLITGRTLDQFNAGTMSMRAEVFLNRVTSPHRDRYVKSPEYKVTAVKIERVNQER
jgi:predicted molibdopterin-dependent oxidoreductase YjgC